MAVSCLLGHRIASMCCRVRRRGRVFGCGGVRWLGGGLLLVGVACLLHPRCRCLRPLWGFLVPSLKIAPRLPLACVVARGYAVVMTDLPQTVPAGWFPDPNGQPVSRWWDGTAWTDHVQPLPTPAARSAGSGLSCSRCHSSNVVVQAVTESKTVHRGCFGWTLWILLAVFTLGLILIIPLLTNSKTRSNTKYVAICQNCGKRWNK